MAPGTCSKAAVTQGKHVHTAYQARQRAQVRQSGVKRRCIPHHFLARPNTQPSQGSEMLEAAEPLSEQVSAVLRSQLLHGVVEHRVRPQPAAQPGSQAAHQKRQARQCECCKVGAECIQVVCVACRKLKPLQRRQHCNLRAGGSGLRLAGSQPHVSCKPSIFTCLATTSAPWCTPALNRKRMIEGGSPAPGSKTSWPHSRCRFRRHVRPWVRGHR